MNHQTTDVKSFNDTIDSIRQNLRQSEFTPVAEVGQAALRMEGVGHQTTLATNRSQVSATLAAVYRSMLGGAGAVSLDENGNARENHHSMVNRFRMRSEEHVKEDAHAAYALAQDVKGWAGRQLSRPANDYGNATSVVAQPQGMSGGFSKFTLRKEAFREVDTHATVAFSLGCGASITRQTEFVMGWYPPIMLAPNQTVLEVQLNLLTVFNGAIHDTDTGDMVKFARRNVARAFEDPNVLNRYATLAVPYYKTSNAKHFVEASVSAPRDVKFGNRTVHTNWLKFNNDFSVIALGTSQAVIESQGKPTHRESLEPGTKMEAILVSFGEDKIRLPLLNLRTMNFVGAQQWDQQETQLFGNVTLGLSGSKLLKEEGTALTGPLKVLADNKLRINVQLKMTGNMNIETGNTHLAVPSLRLISVESIETGQVFAASDATYIAIEKAVAEAKPEGFMFRPFKTNSTKREQGDRLNVRRFVFQYMAPYRDPVAVERMVQQEGDHSAQDLTNLMGLIKIRIENEAIDHALEMFDLMEAYIDMNANDGTLNDLPGLAQFFIIPCFHKETIDLSKHVQGTKSHERAEDIQAYLVMKLRDVATRLLTFSQWKAGMIMQNNDTLPPPQINIATNPIIARYLLAPGDLRTLGDYDYIVTTSLNRNLKDKILMSFRIPGSEASNQVQMFGWGHLLTSAEVVFAANMIRNNDYFSELQIQPRYDFLPMNLTGAVLTVTGIPEVLSRIPGYQMLVDSNNAYVDMPKAIVDGAAAGGNPAP